MTSTVITSDTIMTDTIITYLLHTIITLPRLLHNARLLHWHGYYVGYGYYIEPTKEYGLSFSMSREASQPDILLYYFVLFCTILYYSVLFCGAPAINQDRCCCNLAGVPLAESSTTIFQICWKTYELLIFIEVHTNILHGPFDIFVILEKDIKWTVRILDCSLFS